MCIYTYISYVCKNKWFKHVTFLVYTVVNMWTSFIIFLSIPLLQDSFSCSDLDNLESQIVMTNFNYSLYTIIKLR